MSGDGHWKAALANVERICSQRPELRQLGAVTAGLLNSLFASGDTARAAQPHWPTAAADLAAGRPLLSGFRPSWDAAAFRHSWRDVCRLLAANDPGQAVERLAVQRLAVQRLAGAVEGGNLEPVELLEMVLSQGRRAVKSELERAGLDSSLALVVLRFCSLPHLEPLSRSGEPFWQAGWQRGYCPLCGSWPLLAELRGLEQLRWLRCGLCAARWQIARLCCPYCENRDHQRLHELLPEGQEQKYRLSVCELCRGSLPTLATLEACSAAQLLVAELETVHLRCVAEQHGWLPAAEHSHPEGA